MTSDILKNRTKKFAIDVLHHLETLPSKYPFIPIQHQLSRASMSVGANYRAAVRAKSTADFINKLKIVEEECDECLYFLEILNEISPETKAKRVLLLKEANEILAIMVASIKTTKSKR